MLYIVFIDSMSRTEPFLFLGRESILYGWVCTLTYGSIFENETYRENILRCNLHQPEVIFNENWQTYVAWCEVMKQVL